MSVPLYCFDVLSSLFLLTSVLGIELVIHHMDSHWYCTNTTRPPSPFPKDKSFENKLKSEHPDASRATILECNDQECIQVQCVQQPNGEWKCEEGLAGDNTQKTVLMVSEDDD
jgi:hypothetical protein